MGVESTSSNGMCVHVCVPKTKARVGRLHTCVCPYAEKVFLYMHVCVHMNLHARMSLGRIMFP